MGNPFGRKIQIYKSLKSENSTAADLRSLPRPPRPRLLPRLRRPRRRPPRPHRRPRKTPENKITNHEILHPPFFMGKVHCIIRLSVIFKVKKSHRLLTQIGSFDRALLLNARTFFLFR